jgi:hypothetical protein
MRKNLHIGDEIKKELLAQDLPIAWLARKLGCDTSNLNKKLKSSKMKFDLLKNISTILSKNFCE